MKPRAYTDPTPAAETALLAGNAHVIQVDASLTDNVTAPRMGYLVVTEEHVFYDARGAAWCARVHCVKTKDPDPDKALRYSIRFEEVK